MVSEAKIVGTGFGAEFKNNTCFVDVQVSEVSYAIPQCRLRLKPMQEIRVRTNLSKSECPQDEVSVVGTVMNGGGGVYNFIGDIE